MSKLGSFSVDSSGSHHHFYGHEYTDGRKESSSWNGILDSCKTSSGSESQTNQLYTLQKNVSVAFQNGIISYIL